MTIKDTRLIICMSGSHASTLSKEFAEKHNGKHLKYESTVEVNDVTYCFRSLQPLRDGDRFTEVKVSEGVHLRTKSDFEIVESLKAQARMWKACLMNYEDDE